MIIEEKGPWFKWNFADFKNSYMEHPKEALRQIILTFIRNKRSCKKLFLFYANRYQNCGLDRR